MTVIAGWLTNRSDPAGGQTRAGTRMLPLGTMTPEDAMTVRQGLLLGGDPCAVSGAGMTVSVATGRGVMQGSVSAGAYPVAVTAIDETAVTPGDPLNPRHDLVGLRVYDSLVDGGGAYLAEIQIIEGTPAPTPVDPSAPATAAWMPLARLRIPAGASAGSPPDWGSVIDDMRVYTTSHGGVLPDPAGLAVGAYDGQYRDRAGVLERWDASGSTWTDLYPPAVRLSKTVGYSFAGGAYVAVNWDAADGTPGMWVPGDDLRVYAPRDGLYQLTGWSSWPSGSSACRTVIAVNDDNGDNWSYQLGYIAESTGGQGFAGAVVQRLNAGDFVTFHLYTSTSVTNAPAHYVGAGVQWIAP